MILVFSLFSLSPAVVEAETNSNYQLALEGPTWDHSEITIRVIPQYGKPWWNPSYLNATLNAIDQWNEAFTYFASNNTDYAYLSDIMLIPQVSNSTTIVYDTFLSWIEQFGNTTEDAGLTTTMYTSLGAIDNSTMILAAYDVYGDTLSEVDMQNVALHELGHVFGLGHSNDSGDAMYYDYVLDSPVRALSTLDVYGVATVFRWMNISPQYNRDNQQQAIYSVTLPSSVEYKYLPVPAKDIPPESTIGEIVTSLDDFTQLVKQPEVLIILILAVGGIAAYATITRSHRSHLS